MQQVSHHLLLFSARLRLVPYVTCIVRRMSGRVTQMCVYVLLKAVCLCGPLSHGCLGQVIVHSISAFVLLCRRLCVC